MSVASKIFMEEKIMGTLRQLKNKMHLDKELRPMLVRSMLHEVLLDLDGDKVADIALIDANRDGDIDTIAVDATGNGDFNLYIGDLDGNGIPDNVEFYADGEDMPIAAYFGQAVEDRFIALGERIFERVLAAELIADELIAAFEEFEARAEEEYAKMSASEESAEESEDKDEPQPKAEAEAPSETAEAAE